MLKQCVGQTVLLNSGEERTLLRVEEDFLILQGGNPQMRLTEFVPFAQITRVTRSEFAGGNSSMAVNLVLSGSEMKGSDSLF
jgi:hypothetical protein